MKILITGGAGFIGSHLTQLLSVDHEVIIYDIQEPKQKNVDFIIGDVNDAQKNLENTFLGISSQIKTFLIYILISTIGVISMGIVFVSALMISHG